MQEKQEKGGKGEEEKKEKDGVACNRRKMVMVMIRRKGGVRGKAGRDLANEPLSHNGRHFPHARRPHQRLPRGRQSSLLVQLLQITQRYHQRRESPPRFRVVSSPWWHHVPELRPADAPQEYLPVGAQHDLAVRPSFLSPVKRNYVWTTHPQRQAYSLKK